MHQEKVDVVLHIL